MRGTFKPTILNLGCGTRTAIGCQNIDWSPYLRLKTSTLGRTAARLVLSGERRSRFLSLKGDLHLCDLRRGIPWPDASVQAVYSSHVLEHIDRHHAELFVREMYRVLMPSGTVRVVVPDFEELVNRYQASIGGARAKLRTPEAHEGTIAGIIEQMVRREARGSAQQRRSIIRFVERLTLGDARRRGETHQWMYDDVTLASLLTRVGFDDPHRSDFLSSNIPGWSEMGLDMADGGGEYKPGSLYMEATKR